MWSLCRWGFNVMGFFLLFLLITLWFDVWGVCQCLTIRMWYVWLTLTAVQGVWCEAYLASIHASVQLTVTMCLGVWCFRSIRHVEYVHHCPAVSLRTVPQGHLYFRSVHWPHTDCNNNICVAPSSCTNNIICVTPSQESLRHLQTLHLSRTEILQGTRVHTHKNTWHSTCVHTYVCIQLHACTHVYMHMHTSMHSHAQTHTTNTCTPVIGVVDKRRKKTTISVHHSVDLYCTVR